jgi:hypothetical protein
MFAGHHDPLMVKVAIERLLEHLRASGFVLVNDAEPA